MGPEPGLGGKRPNNNFYGKRFEEVSSFDEMSGDIYQDRSNTKTQSKAFRPPKEKGSEPRGKGKVRASPVMTGRAGEPNNTTRPRKGRGFEPREKERSLGISPQRERGKGKRERRRAPTPKEGKVQDNEAADHPPGRRRPKKARQKRPPTIRRATRQATRQANHDDDD